MNIRFAEIKDRELLISYDKHISNGSFDIDTMEESETFEI